VNGGSGQWKRLCSRMGHALDDDDDELTDHKLIFGELSGKICDTKR